HCFDTSGKPHAGSFSVNLASKSPNGSPTYSIGNTMFSQPLPPLAANQCDPTGPAGPEVTNPEVGTYVATFPGMPSTVASSNVIVNSLTGWCRVNGWFGEPVQASVSCLDKQGFPAN